MRLIHQIRNGHDCRSKLKSKSRNIFEDMKEYFIKIKENLNKIFINKTYFKSFNQIHYDENTGFQR